MAGVALARTAGASLALDLIEPWRSLMANRWFLMLLLCATGCSSSSSGTTGAGSGPDSGNGDNTGSSSGSGSSGSGSGSGSGGLPTQDSGVVVDAGVNPQPDSGSTPLPDSGVADLACESLPTDDQCWNCCTNNHTSGSTVWNNAFYDCVCGPPDGTQGICQTQCAQTDCSAAYDAGGPEAGDPCDTCENDSLGTDGGACASSVGTLCGQSPDCLAFSNCFNNCEF
jgi:hypothetical protein